MTTYTIQITEQADADLRSIYSYIAIHLQARLEAAISALDQMPERYHRYEKEPWRTRNLRVMPVDHFVVFYIRDKDTQSVTIIRVLYGGRDIEHELNPT